MYSDIVKVGMRIEILPQDTSDIDESRKKMSYISMVQDVFSNGDIEIDMPIVQRRLILLNNGARYRLLFQKDSNYYIAEGEIVDRYKSENKYYLRVELKSQLIKFQRREFFRCECFIDIEFYSLPVNEADTNRLDLLIEKYADYDSEGEKATGVALDISGGGLRMVTRTICEEGSYKRFVFKLPVDGEIRTFQVAGVVLSTELQKNSTQKYESRVQFLYISSLDREGIIRYIFEEERKARKLSRG